MYYFNYNKNGDIVGCGFSPDGTIINEGIECTEEQKNNWQLLRIINSQIVDKYTPAELAAQEAAEAAALLVSQAKGLLAASDYRVLPDRFAEFTTDQQTELVAYRAQLRLVARSESAELPTISF